MSLSRPMLRKQMRDKRYALQPDKRERLVAHFTKNALAWFKEFYGSKRPVVSAYVAVEGELCVESTMHALHDEGFPLCLPLIGKNSRILSFRRWQPGDELTTHFKYNIPEPLLDKPTATPECLLIPLVAFDAHGNRLGYGGGYYDASLAALRHKNPNIVAIGCAFTLQRVDLLETEPHDQPMDYVLTEQGAATLQLLK